MQDGRALVSAAERLSPDVIVSDISMPGLDGIAAAAAILRKNPAARIVFVTVHGDPILVERGLATGALGYVLKVAAGDDLIPAVRAALRGERHVSERCISRTEPRVRRKQSTTERMSARGCICQSSTCRRHGPCPKRTSNSSRSSPSRSRDG